jgi:hypothetical protein
VRHTMLLLLCAVCKQIVSFTTEPMTAIDTLDEQKRSVAAVHSENRVRQLHKEVQVFEDTNVNNSATTHVNNCQTAESTSVVLCFS